MRDDWNGMVRLTAAARAGMIIGMGVIGEMTSLYKTCREWWSFHKNKIENERSVGNEGTSGQERLTSLHKIQHKHECETIKLLKVALSKIIIGNTE